MASSQTLTATVSRRPTGALSYLYLVSSKTKNKSFLFKHIMVKAIFGKITMQLRSHRATKMTLPSVARISHLTQFLLQPSLSQGLSASLFIKYSELEASIVFKISAKIQAVLLFSKRRMFYYLACSCRMRSNDFQPFLQTHCCINIFLHTWIFS